MPLGWRGVGARAALDAIGLPYEMKAGDGAFCRPKIDFDIADSIGRKWQLGTIQLDYAAPERFDLKYVGEDNTEHRPVVIHRAVCGSFERFMAIVIEHFAGVSGLARPRAGAGHSDQCEQHDAAARVTRRLRDGGPGPPGAGARDPQLSDPRGEIQKFPTWRSSARVKSRATASRSGARSREQAGGDIGRGVPGTGGGRGAYPGDNTMTAGRLGGWTAGERLLPAV